MSALAKLITLLLAGVNVVFSFVLVLVLLPTAALVVFV